MEQQIFYKNSKGDKISAILSSVNDNRDSSIIIIAHGFASTKNGSSKELSEKLNSKGIDAFRFDFYGHGESEGNFEDITISEEADDILKAIDYLKGIGYKKIGLLGTSFGGTCSIIAASQSKDLYILALRSPVADYCTRELMNKSKSELNDWKVNGFRIYTTGDKRQLRLKYSFLEDMKNLNGFKSGEMITVPTFIVHGDKDTTVPIILSEMLIKTISNSSLRVIEGADHRYSDPNLDKEAKNALINFIINNLTNKK